MAATAAMCKALTEAQYARIAHVFPVQRGNVAIPNLQVLNALLYIAEQGCKWRALPERFGRWHTIYTRLNRWTKQGVLQRVWAELLHERLAEGEFPAAALDSTIIGVHQQGAGALKKGGLKRLGARAAG